MRVAVITKEDASEGLYKDIQQWGLAGGHSLRDARALIHNLISSLWKLDLKFKRLKPADLLLPLQNE